MDPAEPPSPRNRFERIEGVLMLHEQRLEEAAAHARQAAEAQARAVTALTAQLQQLTSTLSSPEATVSAPAPPPPAPVPALPRMISEPRLGAPECYNGDPKLCRPFLTSCSLLFSLQPHTFATEGAKVAYVISNLTGRALLWGTAEWERQTPACASFRASFTLLQPMDSVLFHYPAHTTPSDHTPALTHQSVHLPVYILQTHTHSVPDCLCYA
ncbi:hypothetical protein D4764_06G0008080 [Takifugu flavidus]|uniref:DUF4939 domain-containing protein n=1 Tax=Takifugu flavidus TaxID=433684 RepID=A0A5C6MY07_9TELE|nr:hypothetical protein D4764_06G0008080 [Takifugu flavidus]